MNIQLLKTTNENSSTNITNITFPKDYLYDPNQKIKKPTYWHRGMG